MGPSHQAEAQAEAVGEPILAPSLPLLTFFPVEDCLLQGRLTILLPTLWESTFSEQLFPPSTYFPHW